MDRLIWIADHVFLFGIPILCVAMYLSDKPIEGTILLAAQFIVRGLKSEDAP